MEIRVFEGGTISEKITGHYGITVQRRRDIITIEVHEHDYVDIDAWHYTNDVIEERTGRVITIKALGTSGSRENFHRTPELLGKVVKSVENQIMGVL